jgi:hypothetical protein
MSLINPEQIQGGGGGGGITPTQHETLHQLIHFISEGPATGFLSGAYKVVAPTGVPFPTSVIWYTDNTQTRKIVEKDITYTGVVPTVIVWKMYDNAGVTVINTVTDTITYVNGVFENTRTRVIT